MRTKLHLQKGMTLVELLVVLAIFTIMSMAIMNTVASFYRYNAYTIAQAYQVNNARRGIESLVRDLREMSFADDGAFPLISKNTFAVSFYSDIDRDSSVELVTYTLASTTLYKYVYNAVGTPPVYSTSTPDETLIISRYVQNLNQPQDIFAYYDDTGLQASSSVSVTDIKYIAVNLIINIDPIRDPGEFSLRSSAALRNLKSGL